MRRRFSLHIWRTPSLARCFEVRESICAGQRRRSLCCALLASFARAALSAAVARCRCSDRVRRCSGGGLGAVASQSALILSFSTLSLNAYPSPRMRFLLLLALLGAIYSVSATLYSMSCIVTNTYTNADWNLGAYLGGGGEGCSSDVTLIRDSNGNYSTNISYSCTDLEIAMESCRFIQDEFDKTLGYYRYTNFEVGANCQQWPACTWTGEVFDTAFPSSVWSQCSSCLIPNTYGSCTITCQRHGRTSTIDITFGQSAE